MKKLALCLAAVALGAGCMKKIDVETSPVAAGIQIYNIAAAQNLVSLEPANVAFRLFILLKEALDQGVAPKDAVVDYNGKSGVNLKGLLFGSGYYDVLTEITDEGGGAWKIVFPDVNSGGSRNGTLTVSTGGKLLDEDGAAWTLSSVAGDRFSLPTSAYGVHLSMSFNSYSISKINGVAAWDISCGGVDCAISSYPDYQGGSWALDYTLTAVPDASKSATGTFINLFAANDFVLSGSGDGESFNPYYDGCRFTYETTSPLHYTLACNAASPTLYSGVERCAISSPAGYDLSAGFPSQEVAVDRSPSGADKCNYTITVRYNGIDEVQR
jgi:hypothetical protein